MSDGSAAAQKQWFGHPGGLSTLFFTEMWERFSYYGMRALLILFMTAAVSEGGLGWGSGKAGPIYGLYVAMVYMTALPGGWIADRVIGQRRAVFVGGIIIALGHVSLMFHGLAPFYLGLFLIVVGTGLLKPNISTMVGELYSKEDARRDAGFSIFYMGINLGAFLAPLACGYLAQSEHFKENYLIPWGFDPAGSWHWGFGAAAVGMTLGLIQYVATGAKLGNVGIEPLGKGDDATFATNKKIMWAGVAATVATAALLLFMNSGNEVTASVADADSEPLAVKLLGGLVVLTPIVYFIYLHMQKGWNDSERKRLVAIPIFFFAAALFWSAFEQAGSSLTLFADQFTQNSILGRVFPSSWWQSVNAILIVLLAPLFAILWVRLAKQKREPSSPTKFASGLFFVGVGFLVLAFGAMFSGPEGARVSPMWLFMVYLLHTIGELCLSPVGLSTMTKLAPARVTGQMMGVWFMATSVGNFIGGKVAGLFDTFPLPQLFGAVFATSLLAAIIMLILTKWVRGLMGGVN